MCTVKPSDSIIISLYLHLEDRSNSSPERVRYISCPNELKQTMKTTQNLFFIRNNNHVLDINSYTHVHKHVFLPGCDLICNPPILISLCRF